jgi:hypothetical protein
MSGGIDGDYQRAQRFAKASRTPDPVADAYAKYLEGVQPGGWAVQPRSPMVDNEGRLGYSLGQWDPSMNGAMPYNAFAALHGALGGARAPAPAPAAPAAPAPAARPPMQDPSAFMPALPPPTMRATQRVAPGVQGLLSPAQLYLPQGRG